MIRLNAKQLRDYVPDQEELAEIRTSRRELFLLLDDVQDTYNIGSFFRLADSVGVKRLYLCGKSECPPNPRIEKASVGTHKIVDWEYAESAVSKIQSAKLEITGLRVIAIEQFENSVDWKTVDYDLPLLLVVGHESHGVSAEVLAVCDAVVELPMRGVNSSMNVLVSAAMVLGHLD